MMQEGIDYRLSSNGHVLTIMDGHDYSKRDFESVLGLIHDVVGDAAIFTRTYHSLMREWTTHNGLYSLGIARSRTKDVDFNYPLTIVEKIVYSTCGRLFRPFIK